MTISEVIAALSKLPSDAELFVRAGEAGFDKTDEILPIVLRYYPRPFCGDYKVVDDDDEERQDSDIDGFFIV